MMRINCTLERLYQGEPSRLFVRDGAYLDDTAGEHAGRYTWLVFSAIGHRFTVELRRPLN
jgi:hypothetical protein